MAEVALPSSWGSLGFGKPAAEKKPRASKKHKKSKKTFIENVPIEEAFPEVEDSFAMEAATEKVTTPVQSREWEVYEAEDDY